MQQGATSIHVENTLYDYISALMQSSRNSEWLRSGVSPRGGKALLKMGRARAYISGRTYLIPGGQNRRRDNRGDNEIGRNARN